MRTILIFVVLGLAFLSPSQAVSAASVGCNQCWLVAPIVFTRLGAYGAFQTTWSNVFNSDVTGIVIVVIHNRLGQTAEISTSVLRLAPGASGTAYPVEYGLDSGEYLATIFVVTTSGVAISTTSSVSFSV